MKNLLNIVFVFVFVFVAISCGNKTNKNNGELDSTDQAVLSDSVVAQLDSMANVIIQIADTSNISEIFSKEKINLSSDLKKVKPDYLITEQDIKDVKTLQQKYVALAYLCMDNAVQQIYDNNEGTDIYNRAIGRLAAETEAANQKAAKAAESSPLTLDNARQFYKDMKARNCLDQFYTAEAAYLVEALYIVSRNVDIYMPSINDQTAANLSKRLATVIAGAELIAANHPQMEAVAKALEPIKGINATTSAQLKEQIVKAHDALAKARKALIEA